MSQRAISQLFPSDEGYEEYAARYNAGIGVSVGRGMGILELIMLVSALVRSSHEFHVAKVVAYVVLGMASWALAILSRRRSEGKVNKNLFMAYLIGYLCVAAIYGISNSLQDFAEGKQIITFYIMMMLDTCIFATPPIGVLNLVAVSYGAVFLLGFSGGRLDTGSVVNFWISSVVVTVAGVIRYRECRRGYRNECELRRIGTHDGLTGLRNRMALRADFASLVGRDQYVVMADLDDFKLVNDSYGHEAGDAVLVAYADALTACFPEASCYRYGGDEFLLFVPADTQTDMAYAQARLANEFGEVTLGSGKRIRVGASLGYKRGSARDADELRMLVRAADADLYEVKRMKKAGR